MAKINNNSDELYKVDELTLLDCRKIHFTREKSGFLTLEYDGEIYHKVLPTRLVPFFSKNAYISLAYETDENEFREIGVIRDMKELNEKQYETLDSYLKYKYFMPEITKVFNIRDNMQGSIFIKSMTTSGEKTICVKDWYQNFRMLNDDYLYVCDADGNKYYCEDIHKLDKKSLSVLEMFT